MISQDKCYYLDGFTIPWFQIYDEWQKIRESDPRLAKAIGDPSFSDKACRLIAAEIANQLNRKLGRPIIKPEEFEDNDGDYNTLGKRKNTITVKPKDEVDVDWRDQSSVFTKAMEDIEKKHKEERKRQEDAAKFWKEQEESRKYQQQKQKEYQQNYKKQQPPIQPKPIVPQEPDFRYVLNIEKTVVLTEEVVKIAFRKQVMIHHPDKGGKAEKFKELLSARDKAYYYLGLNPP